MREIILMRDIGYHPCIVSMLACVTRPSGDACIVMDYCAHGDLKTYLMHTSDEYGWSVSKDLSCECSR